ncbi:MAG: RNA polymerase sigma factor [Cyclobacteriaceae bacterium]|nr:RNA polymerase sigma factor [Cyclobacteriaceae bacterium]
MKELVDRLKSKDKVAYEELIDRYNTMVYNTSMGFLGNADEAEDAAQEVFITVFEKIHKFEKRAQLKTWIYRITVNVCLQQLRKRKNKMRSIFTGKAINEPADFKHPGLVMEEAEMAKMLYNALLELPDDQQTAFTLLKLEGLSYEEIGEVMKKSKSSVESLLHRAKSNLRKLLVGFYDENMKYG